MDILLLLGAGALSLSIIYGLTNSNKGDFGKTLTSLLALTFINFGGTFLAGKLLKLKFVIKSPEGIYFDIRIMSVAILLIVAICVGLFFAFVSSKLSFKLECKKIQEADSFEEK